MTLFPCRVGGELIVLLVADGFMLLILQIEKLRYTEAMYLAQTHIAGLLKS